MKTKEASGNRSLFIIKFISVNFLI